MILIIVVSITVGFIIAQFEPLTRLLNKFRYDKGQDIEPAPESTIVYSTDRHVTIFPKQKKGRSAKYYPEETKKFICDLVTYKDGVLMCHLKDSMLEEEFNIKDIDEFII